MFLARDALDGNTAAGRHFQRPLNDISGHWSGDVLAVASECQGKSVRAESKVVLVHNPGYNLRFILRQEQEQRCGLTEILEK